MQQARLSSIGGITVGAILPSAAATLVQFAAPDNTLPYRRVFQPSQDISDQSGDVARGDLYRKVVREKVERCPFSGAEKASFRAWADTRNAAFAGDCARAAARGAVPGTPEEQHRSKALAAAPRMRVVLRRIDEYGRGKARSEDVIGEVCRPSAQ